MMACNAAQATRSLLDFFHVLFHLYRKNSPRSSFDLWSVCNFSSFLPCPMKRAPKYGRAWSKPWRRRRRRWPEVRAPGWEAGRHRGATSSLRSSEDKSEETFCINGEVLVCRLRVGIGYTKSASSPGTDFFTDLSSAQRARSFTDCWFLVFRRAVISTVNKLPLFALSEPTV